MADAKKNAEQTKGYPMLPIAHWWTLRKRFKQTIPGVVTDGYLATVLKMGANSARANVLPYLKTLGIIDQEGRTGDRAAQWRDDGRYSDVCKQILAEVYPQELRDAVSDTKERAQAETWFAHDTRAGATAVARMAVLYMLLLEADVSKQPDEKTERARSEKKRPGAKVVAVKREVPLVPAGRLAETPVRVGLGSTPPQLPGININLEIHISADATSDQIDAIFAGMAKHIYKNG